MMKSLRIALSVMLVLILTTAVSSFAAAPLKIATFNLQEIVEKSKAGAEARKVMDAKNSELQAKFKGEQESLKAQADEIEKKGSAWSDEVKAGKERDQQKKMREFQLKVEDAKFELKQLEKKVLDPFFKELQAVINEIGQSEGYTLIFEKTRSAGLIYAADSLDISDRVTKALDAKMSK